MVIDAIISVLAGFVAWLVALISVPESPAFLGDLQGYLDTASGYVTGTGQWIPWPIMVGIFAAWGISIVAMVSIKGVRIVASFLTLGGGSAA